MLEEILKDLDFSFQKQLDIECPYCHKKETKTVTYFLKIELSYADGKRFYIYYETPDIPTGDTRKYIGINTGFGKLKFNDALKEFRKVIMRWK